MDKPSQAAKKLWRKKGDAKEGGKEKRVKVRSSGEERINKADKARCGGREGRSDKVL